MLKIDLHAHSFPLPYFQKLMEYRPGQLELKELPQGGLFAVSTNRAGGPPLPVWDLDYRLREMEKDGVSLQIISNPGINTINDERSPELCRITNDAIAEACRQAPDRLRGFAHVPLNDMSAAVKELSRAIDELGFKGVIVGSNAGGRYLHTPDFLPFWEEVNRRRLAVFVHPVEPPGYQDDFPAPLVAYPADTTVSITKLIYAGVLERFPDLALIVPHLGGVLPFLARRIDTAYDAPAYPPQFKQIPRRPSEYMKNLYLDTAQGWYKPAFDCACELVGIDHIVYGSDVFMRPDVYRPWINEFLEGLDIPPVQKEKIYGRTAEELLRL